MRGALGIGQGRSAVGKASRSKAVRSATVRDAKSIATHTVRAYPIMAPEPSWMAKLRSLKCLL